MHFQLCCTIRAKDEKSSSFVFLSALLKFDVIFQSSQCLIFLFGDCFQKNRFKGAKIDLSPQILMRVKMLVAKIQLADRERFSYGEFFLSLSVFESFQSRLLQISV